MRLLLILNLFLSFSFASLLDFHYLSNAKEAYEKKEYESASKLYDRVAKDGNKEAKFNLANSLYRQKKYKEAIEVLDSIDSKELSFKKFHNIGNSYANMNNIDEAIKAYEKALTIKEDEDTKYNLELLKKKKKEQKKQEQKNKDKKENKQEKQNKKQDNKDKEENNQKQNDSGKEKQKQENKSKEQKKDEQQNSSKDDKNEKQEKKTQNEKNQDKQKKDKEQKQEQEAKKDDKEKQQAISAQIQNKPISDMEERKWQKMLNQRGVNTLMLPLNSKGDKKDETNPW